MRYGGNISHKPCSRCLKPLGNKNLHFQDGMWWHRACYDEGAAQLQTAMRIAAEARGAEQAERFGFTPANWQGNPQFWRRD